MRQLSGTESCRTLVGVALAGAALAASMLMAAPAAAQVTRLSETASATAGDKSSRDVSVSEDGRFVAFTSDATNLVAGDTNGVSDAFVKDRTTGAVTRVSVGTGGTQAVARSWHPVFSANGRYVAFATESSLDPADAGACSATVSSVACVDVYVHDRQTGVTTLASPQPSLGGPVPRGVSPDGRYTLLAVKGLMDGPAGRTTYEVITTYDAVGHTTTLLFEQPIQEDAPVYGHAALSGDGRLVVASVALENAQPDPLPCTSPDRCRRLYIRDALGSPGVTRIDPTIAIRAGERSVDLELLDLSANGRHVLFMASINRGTPRPSAEYGAYVHDRATGITRRVDDTFAPYRVGAVSEDGQTVATCTASPYSGAGYMKLYDRFREEAIRSGASPHTCETAIAISGDGRFVFFDARQSSELPSDPAATAHIYAFDRDEDGDGMSSAWELLFGLDPTVATDASLDADGDGQTNLQEYRAISHPAGAVRRYFAEGAANDFFRTAFNLFNPHATAVVAQLTMVNEGGERSMATVPIPAGGALSVPVYSDPIAPAAPELRWGRAQAPGQAFSTVIESEKLLVAERTMRWGWTDGGYAYGSHAETAIVEPRREWHFAEGATGGYSLYYLLQNPGDEPASVTITYLLPAPAAPISLPYTVAPHSRRSIDVNGEPGLSATEVSGHVVSDLPILAERAMYLSTAAQLFAGGHEGAAVPEPATEWFIAEGATGFFSLYLTVENPGPNDAEIEVTYLTADGLPIVRPHRAPKKGRLTIDVAGEDPRLAATTMGAIVRSTNGERVVVERVMWWPRGAPYEASLTAASRETGLRWGVSGAAHAPFSGVETYLLIASRDGSEGQVTVKLKSIGTPVSEVTCAITRPMPPNRRLTLAVSEVCAGQHVSGAVEFAGTIESSGIPIVAERATYGSTPTQLWATGAATALTKLPDVP